eukprot:8148777-Pyramimonas_sp.AAC.1
MQKTAAALAGWPRASQSSCADVVSEACRSRVVVKFLKALRATIADRLASAPGCSDGAPLRAPVAAGAAPAQNARRCSRRPDRGGPPTWTRARGR